YGDEKPKAFEKWQRRYGHVPKTPTARFCCGKRYFFNRPLHAEIGWANFDGRGMSVVGRNELVVLPPRIRASGEPYGWEISPRDVELAQASDWIIEMVVNNILPKD